MKKLVLCAFALSISAISYCNEKLQTTPEDLNLESETSSFNVEDETDPMKDFMLYKATVILPRVVPKDTKETKTAKSFGLLSYSDFILPSYVIDGVEYNDEGKDNDLIAGDFIYTSNVLFEAEKNEFDYKHLKYIAFPEFTRHDEIKEDFATGQLERRRPPKGVLGFVIGAAVDFISSCSYSYTTQGTTLLGFSCSTGCLEIDCRK